MIYGVDIGVRRVAIAGPGDLRAALILRDPPTGTWHRTGPREVQLIGGFVAAVVPPEAVVWVEQPVSQAGRKMNIQTVARMGMTAGGVFAGHPGVAHLISPTAWKKELVGHGHADKEATAAWLWAHDPAAAEACGQDGDLIDATCLRIFGELVAEGRVEEPWQLPRSRRRSPVRAS